MTKLYLVRHGVTEWNKLGKFQGISDIPLSEEGRAQARLAASRFKKLSVDIAYTSPLLRASETAEIICSEKGLFPIADDRFKEINYGEWEGFTIPELREKYGEEFDRFMKNQAFSEFPGDGTLSSVSERVEGGVNDMLKANAGKNILLVAHGGILRLVLTSVLKFPLSYYQTFWFDNCSISLVEFRDDGDVILRILNDRAHINA